MTRLEIIGELLRFLLERKAWWLAPLVVVLVLVAVLIAVGEGAALVPFLYPLF